MLTMESLLIAEIARAQLLLVAGFIMLGWVLARRQVRMRARVNRDTRAANRELRKIRTHSEPAVPLCDAPAETQRWQVAMFDLQRELKADLDTRIAVVQSLLCQVDQRIARLETLQATLRVAGEITGEHHQAVALLARNGHTAAEIAAETGLTLGDVELAIASMRVG